MISADDLSFAIIYRTATKEWFDLSNVIRLKQPAGYD
jgi:hypothetical protein